MARVDRRRRDDPRGRATATSTCGSSRRSWSRYADRPLKIGSFSAASNVTGIVTDTRAIADAAAPARRAVVLGLRRRRRRTSTIEMSPRRRRTRSPTRTRSSCRRTSSSAARARPACSSCAASCCATGCPTVPGGGTVAYVNPDEHRYLDDPVHREEGGTPAIVESIRAGLVFQLKEAVGADAIRAREERLHPPRDRVVAQPTRTSRSSATSTPSGCRSCRSSCAATAGRYLHHNFVVALLNDLFGIQSRGGCSCAGPYGHRLLGIDLERSHEFEREIGRGCEGIKPGWVRVNFNYFISEAVFRLRRRRGRPRRRRTAGRCCRLPLRPRHRPVAPPAGARSSRRCACTTSATTPTARLAAGDPRTPPPSDALRRLPGRGPAPARRPRSLRRRRRAAPRLSADFEQLRWFELPRECTLGGAGR